MWTKPTQKSLKPDVVFAEKSTSICTHVNRNWDGHIMDKMWQMMQSNDTKTMNLDKDIEEMVRKAKQTGRTGSTKTTRFWAEEEEQDP